MSVAILGIRTLLEGLWLLLCPKRIVLVRNMFRQERGNHSFGLLACGLYVEVLRFCVVLSVSFAPLVVVIVIAVGSRRQFGGGFLRHARRLLLSQGEPSSF